MHYKNGRSVNVGDFVVGISHNSQGARVFGYVLETMPQQGTCNIRLHVLRLVHNDNLEEAALPVYIGPPDKAQKPMAVVGRQDYGDAEAFILAEDGLRMVSAIVDHGKWDARYL